MAPYPKMNHREVTFIDEFFLINDHRLTADTDEVLSGHIARSSEKIHFYCRACLRGGVSTGPTNGISQGGRAGGTKGFQVSLVTKAIYLCDSAEVAFGESSSLGEDGSYEGAAARW